jgi:uncharacterized membrane protein YphA (DoxX/SURF4 family)
MIELVERIDCLGMGTFGIPSAVLWPYLLGFAVLAIGLPVRLRGRVREGASGDLIAFGPLLFAIPMAIFGGDHLVAAKAVATIVPSWIPGHLFWTYFVGFALISAALSFAANKLARIAGILLGIMIFLFVLLIHVPSCFATPFDKTRVTILLRDSALSWGVLAFAASWAGQWRTRGARTTVTIARIVVGIAIAEFGVQHFLNPAFAPGIPQESSTRIVTMPSWIPGHALWAYGVGAIFVVCGLGILLGKQARFAATVLGATVLVLVALVYIPLTIREACDVANGLNYLAIHLALAGSALLLASALPKTSPAPAESEASLHCVPES